MKRDAVNKLILSVLALAVIVPLLAQNVDVTKQRARIKALETEIAKGESQVKELRRGKSEKEQQVRQLGSQVEQRNQLLRAQESQIKFLNKNIIECDKSLDSLTTVLNHEREAYAAMVRSSYRSYRQNSIMTYIFTSDNFIEASRRMVNMRAMAGVRKDRIDRIRFITVDIAQKREELETSRAELSETAKSIDVQRLKLQQDIDVARANIRTMSAKEREAMQQNELRKEQLESAVASLRKAVQGNVQGASFNAKNSFALPVTGGRVKRYMDNMAEITGKEGAKVTSIYAGKVVEIKQNRISGNYDVFIGHGEHITSYAGMGSVAVVKNQNVSQNQVIGTVGMSFNLTSMQSEYKIVFGIYPPDAKTKIRASSLFYK